MRRDIPIGQILLAVAGLVVVGVVVFYVSDLASGKTIVGNGMVTDKSYAPAWTSTDCNLVGKTTVCVPVYHPERFYMCVRVNDKQACGDLAQSSWAKFSVNDRVKATYRRGGITGSFYLQDVS